MTILGCLFLDYILWFLFVHVVVLVEGLCISYLGGGVEKSLFVEVIRSVCYK